MIRLAKYNHCILNVFINKIEIFNLVGKIQKCCYNFSFQLNFFIEEN